MVFPTWQAKNRMQCVSEPFCRANHITPVLEGHAAVARQRTGARGAVRLRPVHEEVRQGRLPEQRGSPASDERRATADAQQA